MVSFQQDLLLTLNKNHENYLSKYNSLIDNNHLLLELNIEEAGKIIEYVKKFKKTISSMNSIIDDIQNIKQMNDLNTKIENELLIKMMPLMFVYRTLLNEKYKTDITEND